MEPSLNMMTEIELVTLSQQGDSQAYGSLVERMHTGLYRFVRRFLNNDEDARDTCQDALIRAYQNLDKLRDPAKFRAWLHHIALNLCRDRHRSASRRGVPLEEDGGPLEARLTESAPRPLAPDRATEQALLSEALNRAMLRLNPDHRAAILLREFQGFTTQEVAEITGVPAATVRTRIYYGLRTMRRELREYGLDGVEP